MTTRVLITGADGQVGRALLKCVPGSTTVVGLTHANLDIGDAGAVSRSLRDYEPDLVINAAAYTAVDRAESEPDAAWRANCTGPGNLAVAALSIGARLLHLSSDHVFDGAASRPYAVDCDTNPLNVYGKSKRAGELAVLGTLPAGSVILRTAWVYSVDGNNFVRTMLRLMQTQDRVRVVADQIGTPTSADSLAHVIWTIAAAGDIRGIFHWADAGVASWYDFAVAIAEEAAALGLLSGQVHVEPIRTEDYPLPARRPAYSVLDKGALQSQLQLPAQHWRARLRSVLRDIRHA